MRTLLLAVVFFASSASAGGPVANGLALGGESTCVRMSDGSARCFGEIYRGDTTTSSSPITVPGLVNARSIVIGVAQICAVLEDYSVRCWETGQSKSKIGPEPPKIVLHGIDGLGPALELALGSGQGCARIADGSVRCWGRNDLGQGADGTTEDLFTPKTIAGLAKVTHIASSAYRSCAILEGGSVRCWGYNARGELGDGSKINRTTPTTIPELTDIMEVALDDAHGCALDKSGSIACWGINEVGALGDGTTKDHLHPQKVPGLSTITQITVGGASTCALLKDETAWCWGAIANYLPKPVDRTKPTKMASGVVEVRLGGAHVCTRTRAGVVSCLGDNAKGQLGTALSPP